MQALGLIEVVGLTAGLEAADVACKTADVELVGYELARGSGYVTIKVLGQVGAVNAAVAAAVSAAGRLNQVVSSLVIPRPASGVGSLVRNAATIGFDPVPVVDTPDEAAPPPEPAAPSETATPAETAPPPDTEVEDAADTPDVETPRRGAARSAAPKAGARPAPTQKGDQA